MMKTTICLCCWIFLRILVTTDQQQKLWRVVVMTQNITKRRNHTIKDRENPIPISSFKLKHQPTGTSAKQSSSFFFFVTSWFIVIYVACVALYILIFLIYIFFSEEKGCKEKMKYGKLYLLHSANKLWVHIKNNTLDFIF